MRYSLSHVLYKSICLVAFAAAFLLPTQVEAGATNALWFANTVYPSWTCDADVNSVCYANRPRDYAFSYIYPATGEAGGGTRAFFVVNEWSSLTGPGTLTSGDTPMLWTADSTYDGARGRSNLRYLGDLSPNVTSGGDWHWGGYPLVRFAWQDWVFMVEGTPDDGSSTLYYRRGNPFDFDGPANDGQPGPPISDFTAANTVWKESQSCETRLSGMTYVPDPNGSKKLYGFVSWNGRKMVNGSCQYAYNGLFQQVKPVVFDFDLNRFKLNGTWYPFGSEFPLDPNVEQPDSSGQYTGSWDIADTPWGYYAFRSKDIPGSGSPSNPPASCHDTSIWSANLNADSTQFGTDYLRAPLTKLQYAPVDPIAGTLLGSWTDVSSAWTPGQMRGGAFFAGVGSWDHGTYLYQTSTELAACWDTPFVGWNPQSGSAILAYDWTP